MEQGGGWERLSKQVVNNFAKEPSFFDGTSAVVFCPALLRLCLVVEELFGFLLELRLLVIYKGSDILGEALSVLSNMCSAVLRAEESELHVSHRIRVHAE